MSATPKNLPKRTRILVKDLLFQEQYHLTDTQVDIMSYVFNAFTWAMKIDGYMVVTNKKFKDDLPQIGQKTLEASLKELENKGLIDKSVVKVAIWHNVRVRGIKITFKGMEYNSSLYSPSHLSIMNAFQERIKELENEKEEILKAQKPQVEAETEIKIEIEPQKEIEVSIPKIEVLEEKEEKKTVDFELEANFSNKEESLEAFIKRTRNRFILTSAPICNMVEGWPKDSTFYLNSYGKLSSSSSNMDFEQVKNPFEINKFWTWLFKNQNRIGEIVDLNKIRKKIAQLNKKYRDKKVKINGIDRWIAEIISLDKGVGIRIRNERGEVVTIRNKLNQAVVYEYDALEKFIHKIL